MRKFIVFGLSAVFFLQTQMFGENACAVKVEISRDYWSFGNCVLQNLPIKEGNGLKVEGRAKNWYVGGLGKYIGQDISGCQKMEMETIGFGKDSGVIKVELYEDDSGDAVIEQDPKKGYRPTKDDRFVYEIKVDWNGYSKIAVPLADFVDNNPEAGDNIWNPQQRGKSGGLVQMQLIFMALNKTGKVNLGIGGIEFNGK